jgi:hypothetical protein
MIWLLYHLVPPKLLWTTICAWLRVPIESSVVVELRAARYSKDSLVFNYCARNIGGSSLFFLSLFVHASQYYQSIEAFPCRFRSHNGVCVVVVLNVAVIVIAKHESIDVSID